MRTAVCVRERKRELRDRAVEAERAAARIKVMVAAQPPVWDAM